MHVEKSEVLREVKFPWIIVSIAVVLSLKSVINVDGLNLKHSANVNSNGVISNEHRGAKRSSIINLCYINYI